MMGWHVIAKKEVHNDRPTMWFAVPDALMQIPAAHKAYDRGEIEIATRRIDMGDYIVNELLVWPRKHVAVREPWFSSVPDHERIKRRRGAA